MTLMTSSQRPFSPRILTAVALAFCALLALQFCTDVSDESSAAELYTTHCGSCHLLPDPADLPKSIWSESVFPEMAARLGLYIDGFDPYASLSMEEAHYVRRSKVYPDHPVIELDDWNRIREYILGLAPDTLAIDSSSFESEAEIPVFSPTLTAANESQLTNITSIVYDTAIDQWRIGESRGGLTTWPDRKRSDAKLNAPVVAQALQQDGMYLAEIGSIGPTQVPSGSLFWHSNDRVTTVLTGLHRPVHIEVTDMNNDGSEELILSEFGHHTGQISLLQLGQDRPEKRSLLSLPGCIKFEIHDMNGDGMLDIIALMSQGWEGVYILYQDHESQFRQVAAIQLPPHYGASWFELFDYDNDGNLDIILANGDNADYSRVLKPYHGLRLYINDGSGRFKEQWFGSIHGATRVISEDFDQDGDIDFGVLAFFANLQETPEQGFVFVENIDPDSFEFRMHTTPITGMGRWLVMDKGDPDQDGDSDILLGAFLLPHEPGYPEMLKKLQDVNANMLYLENQTR